MTDVTNRPGLNLAEEIGGRIAPNDAAAELQGFARNTKVELDLKSRTLRLNGSDLSHHNADPHLSEHASNFDASLRRENLANFRKTYVDYDFCLEDNWSGYFLAQHLQKNPSNEPIVIVHLDDHTDMMPTLLTRRSGSLISPDSGREFSPDNPDNWTQAIASGAINIGSFLTALYYYRNPLHVLHLNHSSAPAGRRTPVFAKSIEHSLLPGSEFAGIQKDRGDGAALGTYHGHANAHELLSDTPKGRVFVHVDLDYLVNDYNGNIGQIHPLSESNLVQQGRQLLAQFASALDASNLQVERWIIASSPGFCGAKHWHWLLEEIKNVIRSNRN